MTLEDLGNIGEFVAAVGVIISLIYLAVQIRQNTRHVQSSVQQSALDAAQVGNSTIYTDAELADLIQRGMSDATELTAAEQFRFTHYVYTSIQVFEALYLQHKAGILDEDFWQARVEVMRFWLLQPGVVWYLARRPTWLASGFRSFLEREVPGSVAGPDAQSAHDTTTGD